MPGAAADSHGLNFRWLVRLRWGAIVGQIVTIVGVERILGIPLPRGPLAAIVALEAMSNLGCLAWSRSGRPVREWHIASIMVLDVVLLTALLYFTEGPYNPFSFLYLVHIALAAVVLRPRWTWTLVVLSLGCSALLFLGFRQAHGSVMSHADYMRVHVQGMWVAFGVAAAFIVYFLMRVLRGLREREAELASARLLGARHEKLASLATLAAGAAHELATPLGTIALVAKELERSLAPGATPAPAYSLASDVALIRSQVERCRAVLDQMGSDAGESAGEPIVALSIETILGAATEGLRPRPRVELEVASGAADAPIAAPLRATVRALRVLLENAQHASSDDGVVLLRASLAGGGDAAQEAVIEVVDQGSGMSAEVLARAGEPFFTTRAPGRGLGLGLFLARAVIERLGGSLRLESRAGKGTRAVVVLPLAVSAAVAAVEAPATIGRVAESA